MASTTAQPDRQRTLIALAAVGLLLASTATLLTSRVPELAGDPFAGMAPDQLVVELGAAAGHALALTDVANTVLGRAVAEDVGAVIAATGPLPVPADASAPTSDGQVGTAAEAADTDHLSAARGRDVGASLDRAAGGLAASITGPGGAASAGGQQDLGDLTAMIDRLRETGGTALTSLATTTAGTELAPATGAIADAASALLDSVDALGRSSAADASGVGAARDAALRAQVAMVQEDLHRLNTAVTAHVLAMRALAQIEAPAFSTIGAGAAGPAVDAWHAQLGREAATALAHAQADTASSGAMVRHAATELAWRAADAGIAASALAQTLETGPAGPVSQLGVTLDAAIRDARIAGDALHAPLAVAVADVTRITTLADRLLDDACAALGCADTGLPPADATVPQLPDAPLARLPGVPSLASWQSATASTQAPSLATVAQPTVPALMAAADHDGDGVVDRTDVAIAGGSVAAAVTATAIAALDVDGDGDADVGDAAAMVATTPLGTLAGTLRGTTEQLVAELAIVLAAAGEEAASTAGGVVDVARALVASADTDVDGQPDRDGVVALTNAVVEPSASQDANAAVLQLRRAAERGLDLDGDGAVSIHDAGCVAPSLAVHVSPVGDGTRALGDGGIDPSSLAALTVVELVRACGQSADADGSDQAGPSTPRPSPEATVATVEAQVIGLMSTLTPTCVTDRAACATAFEQSTAAIVTEARARLDVAAAALVDTLDIDADGHLNRRDGRAFSDRGLDDAWMELIDVTAAINGSRGVDAAAVAELIWTSRPTTAEAVAMTEAIEAITTRLTDAMDVDGDGSIGRTDADILSDALAGSVSVPSQGDDAPRTPSGEAPDPDGQGDAPSTAPSDAPDRAVDDGGGAADQPTLPTVPLPPVDPDPTVDLPVVPDLPTAPDAPRPPATPVVPEAPVVPELPDPEDLTPDAGYPTDTLVETVETVDELTEVVADAIDGVPDATEVATEVADASDASDAASPVADLIVEQPAGVLGGVLP